MSTTVVYASGDSGYITTSDASVYLDAARDNSSISAFGANSSSFAGQSTGATYTCYQAFIKWDTSAIGTDTVSNVDFEVDAFAGPVIHFVAEGYVYDWGTTLTTADFRDSDAGIPALGSIISSYDTSGGWDTGSGYLNDLAANAAFASAIDGSGDTRIVVISQEHRNESVPISSEVIGFECTGNTNDARLTITHAPPGHVISPTDDVTTTGWATAPLFSKIDEDPGSPDATVITGTAS